MDFQQNTQPDKMNEQPPVQEAPVAPDQISQEQPAVQNLQEQQQSTFQDQQMPQQGTFENQNIQPPGSNPYDHNPYGNTGSQPNANIAQNAGPQQNTGSYANGSPNPYQNRQPYQNNMPYQSNTPYGNRYPNSGNNAYPYYNRGAYQVPYAEPGSSLANAAMILGIISIIASFTFTVYPAFILGSIAIVLALLSKGSRTGFFQKAKTGIICGAIGLITNTVIVIFSLIFVFTNPEAREMFDQIFEQQYGMTFEEMMEEIDR